MLIYKIINLINNKIYIGKKSNIQNFNQYWGSGILIKKSIKKYGKDNFKKEIIEYCNTEKELNEKEIYWIKELNSIIPNGYNIAIGGDGRRFGTKCSEETKSKISYSQTLIGFIDKYGIDLGTLKYNQKINKSKNSHKIRLLNINERMKYSRPGKLNGMYNKKHTLESIQKNRNSHIGKHSSEETRYKLKLARAGNKNPNYGNGYKQTGSKNGNANIWELISPENIIYNINGEVQLYCIKLNISYELLRRYKNNMVPVLKFRNCDNNKYLERLNTIGWTLKYKQ